MHCHCHYCIEARENPKDFDPHPERCSWTTLRGRRIEQCYDFVMTDGLCLKHHRTWRNLEAQRLRYEGREDPWQGAEDETAVEDNPYWVRNPDERIRRLGRRAAQEGPEAQQRYFAELYRSGELALIAEEQIAEEAIGPEALYWMKRRFQEGYDIVLPLTNNHPKTEGAAFYGNRYYAVIMHPNQKQLERSIEDPSYPLGQRQMSLRWHYVKPIVIFYDAQYPETREFIQYRNEYGHLGQRTPGAYYVETLLGEDLDEDEIYVGGNKEDLIASAHSRLMGLNFHGGSPSWGIDGPNMATVLRVLDHVFDGWIPPEMPPRHKALLRQLNLEIDKEKWEREKKKTPRRKIAKKRSRKRRCGICRQTGHTRRTCPER